MLGRYLRQGRGRKLECYIAARDTEVRNGAFTRMQQLYCFEEQRQTAEAGVLTRLLGRFAKQQFASTHRAQEKIHSQAHRAKHQREEQTGNDE